MIITNITSNFDNVFRIESDLFLLDVYIFENIPKIGDKFEFKVIDLKDIPKIGTIMNGKIIKLTEGQTHVSFGGLMGSFALSEEKNVGEEISIWISL